MTYEIREKVKRVMDESGEQICRYPGLGSQKTGHIESVLTGMVRGMYETRPSRVTAQRGTAELSA